MGPRLNSISDNSRGIFALTGGMAAYAVSDVATKLVAQTHPFGQTLAVRGAFTILVVAMVLFVSGYWRHVRRAFSGPVLLRALLDALSGALYIAALINMPIANAAALNMVHPLILVALSVIFLREIVGWRRWSAVAVGFIGVLFIVKPTPEAFNIFALAGLGAPLFGALRELVTRRLDPTLPSMAITFVSVAMLTLLACGYGLTEQWRPVTLRELGHLSFAACFFSLASYLAVYAFRTTAEVSAVAPFRYTFLIWAGVAGFVSFNELPDAWAIVGAVLIVASGLYALHRETVRRRAAAN
ncbi:MAG TPA: DMT family transporter [Xanthobacteraceae bacterium]|nr:DMT family transporter [Xanthobacteraceae bacterium]